MEVIILIIIIIIIIIVVIIIVIIVIASLVCVVSHPYLNTCKYTNIESVLPDTPSSVSLLDSVAHISLAVGKERRRKSERKKKSVREEDDVLLVSCNVSPSLLFFLLLPCMTSLFSPSIIFLFLSTSAVLAAVFSFFFLHRHFCSFVFSVSQIF